MQKYFLTPCKILLMGGIMAISQGTSCQSGKDTDTHSVDPLQEAFDKVIEDPNKPNEPYEVDGRSQESFESSLKYIKHSRIRHVRYRGPVDSVPYDSLGWNKKRIVPLLRLDHVASLAVVNQEGKAIDYLELSSCNITDRELASFFGKLSESTKQHVVTLNLMGNHLTKVEGLAQFPKLRELHLAYNQLTTVKDLANLRELRELDLGTNKLTTVNLANLPELESLHLANNQLTTVNLANLPKLGSLDLFYNQLTTVKDLVSLPELKELWLSENKLTTVKDLARFPNLRKLYLRNNLIENIGDLRELYPKVTIIY